MELSINPLSYTNPTQDNRLKEKTDSASFETSFHHLLMMEEKPPSDEVDQRNRSEVDDPKETDELLRNQPKSTQEKKEVTVTDQSNDVRSNPTLKKSPHDLIKFLQSMVQKKSLSHQDEKTITQQLNQIESLIKETHFQGKNRLTQLIEILKNRLSLQSNQGSNLEIESKPQQELKDLTNWINKQPQTKTHAPEPISLTQEDFNQFSKHFNTLKGQIVPEQKIDLRVSTLKQRLDSKNSRRSFEPSLFNLKKITSKLTTKNSKNFALIKPNYFITAVEPGSIEGNTPFTIQNQPNFSQTSRFENHLLAQKLNSKALIHELSAKIRQALVNGKEVMTVRLRPENLGKVHITITKQKEIVNLRLNVETLMIKENIELKINELKNNLENQQMGSFNVEVNLSHSQSQQNQSSFFENGQAESSKNQNHQNLVGQESEKVDFRIVDLREKGILSLQA